MSDKRFNPEKAKSLMRAERKKLLPPNKIIEHLNLASNDTVADLGAGNGYFTLPIAKKTKLVYAVDIEPKMLDMLAVNADEEKIKNIQYVESDLEHIHLDDNAVDKVIISFVIHEVGSVKNTLQEIKRILKPGGEMLLIEWEAVQTESGPPLDHRIPSKDMVKTLKENDFEVELIQLNEANYAVKATTR